MEPESDDDYVDIRPWPISELAGQLVVNAAMGRRGLIEADESADVFERETDRFELDSWARLELSPWMTEPTSRILEMPTGNLGHDQVERCDAALIIASTIGWSLNIVVVESFPLLTNGESEHRVLEWAPGPWTPVRNSLKGLRLRSDEELARERERWELVYWRCSLFVEPSMRSDDELALRETVQEVAGTGVLQTSTNDFTLEDGTLFRDLSPDTIDELRHQSELRLRTLNWVCGFGENVDSAPLFLDE